MIGGSWEIWVDTGGTFTDCVARDPGGGLHRAKVLSSSRLRARVERCRGLEVRTPLAASLPPGFLRGYGFRPLGGDGEAVGVADSDPGTSTLRLVARPRRPPAPGSPCELLSPEEAPLLATRLTVGCALDQPLPPLRMRLATTRGTNALLERTGAPTALFITRGFGDLLTIGSQQRPDLFALRIVKPSPLYREVVEVDERVDAAGRVLVPLDLDGLRRRAAPLLERGVEAAAVALMHSYRRPEHERAAADCLRGLGFRHVSCSAELAPFIKLLPRAETAVVDAYLSAEVGDYLDRVAGALGGGSLHVMTSAGGLVRAAEFRPRDSLLSGPAGGVVGAAAAGERSGFARSIAFDMGGTSTDVSRFDGDYDYRFETRVGDARLMAPALAIETVAAGGGSICRFDGVRLRVGPESAGARPGPACYGAGGPLTLTDVNLLLGRLDPERFEIPIDERAAAAAADGLAARVAGSAGGAPRPEEVLAGCLQIANERMAEAVRRISIRDGRRPGDYALVAFGGAGPQHACALAALLDVGRCLVPPDAGLLSALGLGAARVERFAERQLLRPLAGAEERVGPWLDELAADAARAVAAEGVPAAAVEVRRRLVELRLAGQDATLAVELGDGAGLAESFASAYRDRYGYPPPDRPVEVVSLRAVASSRGPARVRPAEPPPPVAARPAGEHRAWFAGGWRSVPSFERVRLRPGAALAGPALVFERHSATVVESGWRCRVDAAAALVLEAATEQR